MKAEAWFIYRRELDSKSRQKATLYREQFELPEMRPHEVRAEPICGSWEGNMGHGVQRKPIDVVRHRGEDRIIMGNAGVVRVVDVGDEVSTVRPGQIAVMACSSNMDRFGYPTKIHGYDAPHTMGLLTTSTILPQNVLIPLPEDTRYSLAQWAAFSLRYITAWSNFRIAHGVLRLQITEEQLPSPNIWAWGGGVCLGQVDLARREGYNAVMLSGNPDSRALIERMGVTAIDRRQFGDLYYDEKRFASDMDYRNGYNSAEKAFLEEVERRTDGEMVHMFIDNIGAPVYRATLKALARGGVIATQGWKEGQVLSYLRALECIQRHQHVHTHGATYQEGVDSVEYAERNGWLPIADDEVYSFDDIPDLAQRFLAGKTGMFPVYRVDDSIDVTAPGLPKRSG